jgi:DNA-binding beta-propeller fold protein YncE
VFPYRGELWGVWSQVVFINQRHLASSIGIFLVVLIFVLIRYREVPESAAPLWSSLTNWRSGFRDRGVTKSAKNVKQPKVKKTAAVKPAVSEKPEPTQEAAIATPVKRKKAKPGSKQAARESTDLNDTQKFVARPAKGAADDQDSEDAASDEEVVADVVSADKTEAESSAAASPTVDAEATSVNGGLSTSIWPWIFSGVLLGLMPMWNGAIFTAAAAVLAALFVLFPLRKQMFILGVTSVIVALPQIIFLRTGNIQPGPGLLHWGFTVDNPGIFNVLYYIFFTFGCKWLLIGVALVLTKSFQRKFFIAISVLIAVCFCMQFSEEVLANHKFLNVWLVLANLFVAFGLLYIWNLAFLKKAFLGKILAVILTVMITLGGIIDLFPIRNSFWMEMGFVDDPLIKWVTEKTDPRSVFLSFRYVNHRILLAGRRLYFGHPYYAWSAGYPTFQRDGDYRKMLEETNPQEVLRMLKENNISYVAIDNQLRGDVKNVNEAVYQAYFQKVFDDTENKYDNLKIYQVPPAIGAPNPGVDVTGGSNSTNVVGTAVNAFTGGSGNGGGQFSKPRGIAVDSKGNIYVADQGNARIQKFDADGKFVSTFGTLGEAEGQFKEPNGVAVDPSGNVYVLDALNHKLVKFSADGKFVSEWKGPADNNLYGPRDLAIGPNKQIYIVDQGRGRVVRFDPANQSSTEFGTLGSAEGQFHESTGITIADNFVVVADGGNNRIEVFDLDGKFVRQWSVPMWQSDKDPWHYPDVVYDAQAKKLYATCGWTNEVLAYDMDGNLVEGGFKPEGADAFSNPSSIVISEVDKKRRVLVLNTEGNRVSAVDLPPKTGK